MADGRMQLLPSVGHGACRYQPAQLGLRKDGLRLPWGFFLANVSARYTSQYYIFKEAELVITAFVGKGHNGQIEANPCSQWLGFIPDMLLVFSGQLSSDVI